MASPDLSRKPKSSTQSPHPHSFLPEQAASEETLRPHRESLWRLLSPVQATLIAVHNATDQRITDKPARAKVLREGLMTVGSYMEDIFPEPGVDEDTQSITWLFISCYWPKVGTSGAFLRRMYHHLKKGEALKPKAFPETRLGRIPAEIREIVFINLLATPPSFGGREFRVDQNQSLGRPPISLAKFVDLKASCLTVLQTCRQIYLEGFPIFYAGKSYYLANSQDFAALLKFGWYPGVGPRQFRGDTITSLCLKDLVGDRLKWTAQDIDQIMARTDGINRQELEEERTNRLDPDLFWVGLARMENLRKICLCMYVGQEWEYLRFLFDIEGLGRGVINFVDNSHWAIHSQNLLGEDWNLGYAAFPNRFYCRGRDFGFLDYDDVIIHREVLEIDSRASDLDEGDERWIEIDVGSRDYEEREMQHLVDSDMVQMTETQQRIPGEDDVDPHDVTDQESEDLQGDSDMDRDGTRMEVGSDQASHDSLDLSAAGYHNDHIGSDSNNSTTLHVMSTDDYPGASTEAQPEGDVECPGGCVDMKDHNTWTATELNQGLEDAVDLLDDEFISTETGMDSREMPALVVEMGNNEYLQAQPQENIQASAGPASGSQYQSLGDARTRTEPADFAKDLREEYGMAAALSQDVSNVDQSAFHSPKVRNAQQMPAQTELEPSRRLVEASKPLSENEITIPQNSLLKPGNASSQQKREAPLAFVDSNSTPNAKCESLSTSKTGLYLRKCGRAAALMTSPALLYVVLFAKPESILGQLLALILFILLSFVACSSEDE